MQENFQILVANETHSEYASEICTMIEESAKIRGTGIAKRNPDYIKTKMSEGKAIICLSDSMELAGFCYFETWSHGKYVAHSGLIVNPKFRQFGLATKIKTKAFELSLQKFPEAKIFGLTTSLPVMKINSDLGYKPVTFSELTQDDEFWQGCQSCVNYDILTRTQRRHCLCTGMLYDPAEEISPKTKNKEKAWRPLKVYERWLHFKQTILLRIKEQKEKRQERKKQKKSSNNDKKSLMDLFF
jgi:hypothetical protein